ncbi:SpoIVB peptidase S55 domain-containing protein [Isoptericola chiayiensis]|uniref:SpoIVB peptidase S55 domain-containing protein n=1 Tax=Isoptericola chiayiensis TaxID=579446 RepID=UPI0015541846|nr:SpoIVB peptidase S55 domain-containing protein [Isoptericola chiayiensis]NOV99895.1 hypothetical protein [Isoptericola chiayiensis]
MTTRSCAAGRALASCCAVAVAATGLVAVAPPATSLPTADCAVAHPVSDLVGGAPVHGLTVSRGTTPQPFTGEVLGVLSNGIAPGLDMVVAELSSPAIDAAGGIWQGMSGSPVYAEDGRLIGAVAYGLAWGSSPVAGITPFEDMDDFLGAAVAAPRVEVGPRMAARIAAETDVTRAQAGRGLEQLPMPVGVGGVGLARAEKAARARGSTLVDASSTRIGRSGGASAAGIDTVTAGGNVAAVLAHGDVTLAGVGSVTSVCGDRVVAFGHPMGFTGRTRLGLAAADAVYVQPDPLGVPFKVANLGELGGTVTDDRLAGIAGTFGPVPAPTTFTSRVAYAGAARTGTTEILHRSAAADVALFGVLGNHDRVVDGVVGGSQTQTWTITGTHGGESFRLRYADRYRSGSDIGWTGAFDLATVVATLSSSSRTRLDSVRSEITVRDDRRTFKVAKVRQRTGGKWVDVTGGTAKVRAGGTLKLRAVLSGSDGATRTVRRDVRVPKRLQGERGVVSVVGGNVYQDDFWSVRSFDAVRTALRKNLRNDEVELTVSIGGGKDSLERVRRSDPLPRVVGGQKHVRVKVTR